MGPDLPATCAELAWRSSRSTDPIERSAVQRPSDPLDAVEAARAALSGRTNGSPKSRDGAVEAIRVLVVAKRSARQARTKALIQMRHLGYTAPDQLRCRLKGLSVSALVAREPSSGQHDRPIR
jgi:hypothetical protein